MDEPVKKQTYIQRISMNNHSKEKQEEIVRLFNENINIAYKIAAKYYKTKYWDKDESIAIAQLGLFKACLIWDPEKYKLTTLAYNIINRDFIEFDKQQKKQVDVLFSLDEEIKTAEQVVIGEIIQDTHTNYEQIIEQNDSLKELNQDILFILEDIADELFLPKSLVKIIYLVYIESQQDTAIGISQLRFIKKSVVNLVIEKLQDKLRNILNK